MWKLSFSISNIKYGSLDEDNDLAQVHIEADINNYEVLGTIVLREGFLNAIIDFWKKNNSPDLRLF